MLELDRTLSLRRVEGCRACKYSAIPFASPCRVRVLSTQSRNVPLPSRMPVRPASFDGVVRALSTAPSLRRTGAVGKGWPTRPAPSRRSPPNPLRGGLNRGATGAGAGFQAGLATCSARNSGPDSWKNGNSVASAATSTRNGQQRRDSGARPASLRSGRRRAGALGMGRSKPPWFRTANRTTSAVAHLYGISSF